MFPENPAAKIKEIADSVLKLSDFYIQNPQGETPWAEKFCQMAYRHYYLPLNFLRLKKVIERGNQVGFFKGLKTFVDWGCGPGTASLALAADISLKTQIQKQVLYDISQTAIEKFSDLHSSLVNAEKPKSFRIENFAGASSCLVFSYSLTEINELPSGWNNYEALMIVEPSTSEDGRRLMELRTKLINAGYFMWAPCTHQLACPLLTLSKNDWCHDRALVEAPSWFSQVEQNLPMKNKTVTMSYLLARKTPPPDSIQTYGRLVGDSMEEKGKTRQLFCRGPEREFLTWMHKSIEPQTLPRGELVFQPSDAEKKSNEIRLKSNVQPI
jgi:ribosomal protein RSM22 (predicted rRNA methylase)